MKSETWPFKNRCPLEWGWEMEHEGAPCEGPIDISRLELVPFHNEGEKRVSGEELMRRVRDESFSGCAGWSQHHAEQLLEQTEELPTEWECDDGPSLLFPDTVFLVQRGQRSIPCLFWEGGLWQLAWIWLEHGFRRRCRLFRLYM